MTTVTTPAGSELIDLYRAGTQKLRESVHGLDDVQLRATPVPGAWSTLQVLCHLADSEMLFAERMKRVLAEHRPPLPFADPALHMKSLACDARNAEEELAVMEAVRRQMARILKAQPAEAWRRVGIHSREGERTLEQLLQKAVDHLAHHLAFIREKRRALGIDA
ncbi:MAG: DinB family protein [Planctomycetaceae bacterium]|nr:DinB family protein [Planctomycetaceae bacterium]